MDAREALKHSQLFHEFTPFEALKVTEIARRRFFAEGEHVFRAGDDFESDPCLYIMLSGLVKVTVDIRDGLQLVLAIMTPPSHIGDIAFIDHRPRTTDVVAMKDTEALMIMHDALDNLLGQDREMSVKFYRGLARSMAGVIRNVDEKIRAEFKAP